jgi:hypothetical protein
MGYLILKKRGIFIFWFMFVEFIAVSQNKEMFKAIIKDNLKPEFILKDAPNSYDVKPLELDSDPLSNTNFNSKLKNAPFMKEWEDYRTRYQIAPALMEAIKNPDLGWSRHYYVTKVFTERGWVDQVNYHSFERKELTKKQRLLKNKSMRKITEIFYPVE